MMLAFSLSLSAQALTDVTSNNAASYLQKKQSSIELEYEAAHTNGCQIGANVVYKYLLVGGSAYFGIKTKTIMDFGFGPTISEEKGRFQWDGHIGGNYRYFFLNDDLFAEGRLLLGYHNAGSYKVKAGEDWEKNKLKGNMYLGINPRLGMNLGKVFAVVGYRWDFDKFKFDKEHFKAGYFTVGLAYVF